MSLRYEFIAEPSDGALPLPEEIAARIRQKGIRRLRVVVTSLADDEARLAERGINGEAIDRVAEAQRIDRDIATIVLTGEGAADEGELHSRLRQFADDRSGRTA